MGRTAVFAYGSLVNAESAARTLGRPAEGGLHLAELVGWRRRWSQARDNRTCEKTFARTDSGEVPQHVLGLNIERVDLSSHSEEKSTRGANGVLIAVSEEELARLDVREMRYDRVDVTADVSSLGALPSNPTYDCVVTYVAKEAHFSPAPPDDAVILAPYLVAVEAAFASLGEDQLGHYRETTDEPPVEVIDATLVRDRIPPGNPREW
jgi:hypothetical protein